ncbi:sister chromatid cohesion protein PDS5 homolog C isoform X2 [Hevea brasiliensis]|uniref:sister chromatid cohesion protein PDS5 homolog C isoform X2 n=1 Tax=Hevea brasiliensis TaxID=3981 RepID=UPI0025D72633|nr:sister chromatid cohesion protein PDS5 homolog C isoform X2 [Hevea brasiliensis]
MAMEEKDQLEMEEAEKKDKKLAEDLAVAGNALLSSLSTVEQLLPLLQRLGDLLAEVKQSPSNLVRKALNPAMNALTSNELLNHLDAEVKVFVASSICEIMRITAPISPYGDEQLKKILKLIVAAFDNISDLSSRSYLKRVYILEIFVRIRLWVLLLDLECDSLILEMFNNFLRNIREYHPDVVFMYMGFCMIMVLEEIEEIPSELLSSLLGSVRKGNQNVLPIARKLGERVIENCASKLALYIRQAVQYTGLPLDNYGKIVAYICSIKSDPLEHNEVLASQANNTGKHAKIIPSAECNTEPTVNETNALEEIPMEKSARNGTSTKEKTCLAPDDKHFGEDLIGSRIKVLCSKEQMVYEGDIVSYDPNEKKHKVQCNDGDEKMLLLGNEQFEFVGDEGAAHRGKLVNVPILDDFCDLREGTSARKVDVKVPESGSDNPKDGENSFKWETETSKDVGNIGSKSAVESKGESDHCCESKESAANAARKLNDSFTTRTIEKDDMMAIEEGENKNGSLSISLMELPLKTLVPGKFKKLRSPRWENHQIKKCHINPGHEVESSSQG